MRKNARYISKSSNVGKMWFDIIDAKTWLAECNVGMPLFYFLLMFLNLFLVSFLYFTFVSRFLSKIEYKKYKHLTTCLLIDIKVVVVVTITLSFSFLFTTRLSIQIGHFNICFLRFNVALFSKMRWCLLELLL